MSTYTIISASVLLVLCLVWKRSDLLNFMIKVTLAGLAIWGFILFTLTLR
jgi:hypothetical protein